MYVREKPLTLKGSTSHMTNNLAVLKNPDKGVTSYASVHKTLVNMISCGVDGSVQHRQVVCQKDPNSHGGNLILQVSLLIMLSNLELAFIGASR